MDKATPKYEQLYRDLTGLLARWYRKEYDGSPVPTLISELEEVWFEQFAPNCDVRAKHELLESAMEAAWRERA